MVGLARSRQGAHLGQSTVGLSGVVAGSLQGSTPELCALPVADTTQTVDHVDSNHRRSILARHSTQLAAQHALAGKATAADDEAVVEPES